MRGHGQGRNEGRPAAYLFTNRIHTPPPAPFSLPTMDPYGFPFVYQDTTPEAVHAAAATCCILDKPTTWDAPHAFYWPRNSSTRQLTAHRPQSTTALHPFIPSSRLSWLGTTAARVSLPPALRITFWVPPGRPTWAALSHIRGRRTSPFCGALVVWLSESRFRCGGIGWSGWMGLCGLRFQESWLAAISAMEFFFFVEECVGQKS